MGSKIRRLLLWGMLGMLGLTAAVAVGLELGLPGLEDSGQGPILELTPIGDPPEFARALRPRELQFPADHGPHLEFQTEWWYYIGNLQTADGRHFGFQLTFFRRGLQPGEPGRPSAFAANHIYSAHLALTDTAGGAHRAWERYSRAAAGLAGAQSDPYRVWLDDWTVEALNATADEIRLYASEEDFELELVLEAEKPPVPHGEAGLSQKSLEPGNASYYVSYTRMSVSGRIGIGQAVYQVQGQGWFDHEWGTTALGPEAVGWDWFGLQLDDGRELMVFQIRKRDGTIEPVSGGTLVDVNGSPEQLSASQLQIWPLDTWTSPGSGAVYPSGWQLQIPERGIELTIQPQLADQENRLSVVYWEGAVAVSGTSRGEAVAGQGYAELTGYFLPLVEGDF
jgi:predicted secreted hydrolase